MNSSPSSMNFWPDVLTKPDGAGVGAAEAELLAAELETALVLECAGVLAVAPGMHWKNQSFR